LTIKAKERIDYLVDSGSFFEVNDLAESQCTDFEMPAKAVPGDGVVTGTGRIGGRKVLLYSQDATALRGSVGLTHALKIRHLLDLALTMGLPIVGLNESVGGRIQEGIDTIRGYSHIFSGNIQCSGIVPQIAAVFGSCAGGAVYSPALMDFIFMIDQESHMFITGPVAVESVTGGKTTKEQLGGAQVHAKLSGVTDFNCMDEAHCLDGIKQLLSYLPSNFDEKPPLMESTDDASLPNTELDSLVPENIKEPYDMKSIIRSITDYGDFLEVKSLFARNLIVGFARLNGRSVGLVANQPMHLAGAIDINAAVKAARFIRFCDCFNIPLVTFVDTPAYLPGMEQEQNGIIRHGAKMLFAYGEASVPKITIIIRKGYGGGNPAMCNKEMGADFVLSWPTAEIAVLGAEAAAEVLFRNEIQGAADPEETRRQKISEYRRFFSNPYLAAKKQYIDGIIDPRATRAVLIELLDFLETKEKKTGLKGHGNIPL
jgi:acetyl-CoA carboxylase carboxyltransferase component